MSRGACRFGHPLRARGARRTARWRHRKDEPRPPDPRGAHPDVGKSDSDAKRLISLSVAWRPCRAARGARWRSARARQWRMPRRWRTGARATPRSRRARARARGAGRGDASRLGRIRPSPAAPRPRRQLRGLARFRFGVGHVLRGRGATARDGFRARRRRRDTRRRPSVRGTDVFPRNLSGDGRERRKRKRRLRRRILRTRRN